MRENLDVQKSIGFPQTLADQIEEAAAKLNTNFSEIVRECVISDLPKLIDRETKKRTRTRKPEKPVKETTINVNKWLK